VDGLIGRLAEVVRHKPMDAEQQAATLCPASLALWSAILSARLRQAGCTMRAPRADALALLKNMPTAPAALVIVFGRPWNPNGTQDGMVAPLVAEYKQILSELDNLTLPLSVLRAWKEPHLLALTTMRGAFERMLHAERERPASGPVAGRSSVQTGTVAPWSAGTEVGRQLTEAGVLSTRLDDLDALSLWVTRFETTHTASYRLALARVELLDADPSLAQMRARARALDGLLNEISEQSRRFVRAHKLPSNNFLQGLISHNLKPHAAGRDVTVVGPSELGTVRIEMNAINHATTSAEGMLEGLVAQTLQWDEVRPLLRLFEGETLDHDLAAIEKQLAAAAKAGPRARSQRPEVQLSRTLQCIRVIAHMSALVNAIEDLHLLSGQADGGRGQDDPMLHNMRRAVLLSEPPADTGVAASPTDDGRDLSNIIRAVADIADSFKGMQAHHYLFLREMHMSKSFFEAVRDLVRRRVNFQESILRRLNLFVTSNQRMQQLLNSVDRCYSAIAPFVSGFPDGGVRALLLAVQRPGAADPKIRAHLIDVRTNGPLVDSWYVHLAPIVLTYCKGCAGMAAYPKMGLVGVQVVGDRIQLDAKRAL
jgi:hypothetical protein